MFLLRNRLQREADLFNIVHQRELEDYNRLLAEDGRSLRILSQQEHFLKGSVQPETEWMPQQVDEDAYYMFVIYEKVANSPYQSRASATNVFGHENMEAVAEGIRKSQPKIDVTKEPPGYDTIEVEPGDTNESILAKIHAVEAAKGEIVIDVTDSVKAKKTPKKKAEKKDVKAPKGVPKAPKKEPSKAEIVDLPKRRVQKAKTPKEAIEIAATTVAAEIKQDVRQKAEKIAKDVVAGIKESMPPEQATEFMKTMLKKGAKENPEAFQKAMRDVKERGPKKPPGGKR